MPRARKFMAVPITIWSARRWMVNTAWTAASRPPAIMATSSPTIHDPPHTAPQMPKKAPISIIPSRPMLTTPERSENTPPMAAYPSGAAYTRVAANSPELTTSPSVVVLRPCAQTEIRTPAIATATAHPPARHSRACSAQAPQPRPTTARATGAPWARTSNGGRVSQTARKPAATPARPTARAPVGMRPRIVVATALTAASPRRSRPGGGGRAGSGAPATRTPGAARRPRRARSAPG